MLTGFLIGTFLTLGLVFGVTSYMTFLILRWGHRHPARLRRILNQFLGLVGIPLNAGPGDRE